MLSKRVNFIWMAVDKRDNKPSPTASVLWTEILDIAVFEEGQCIMGKLVHLPEELSLQKRAPFGRQRH